ncbi:hypothetical protein [Frankia sp. AgB32]|uniref:PH-like domain-containing protein n=1 Tax=Frankia sp. AgB32 TaxID=631119 RepID=UPI00200E27B8|nr:hypothetical protein [Frankia sp. AgB32]MCK9897477.1 hypothetical protein [Frankia sp. AgB32]
MTASLPATPLPATLPAGTSLPGTSVVLALGRAPSRLGLQVLLAVGLLLLLVAIVGALARAWQSRATEQEENLPDLPEPPTEPGTVLAAPLRGTYLGTVDAGHWLEWIAARGLGGRIAGYVSVYETGVRVDRGGDTFWIPRDAVRGARLERAHAGKVSAPGRLIVIAWSYGGHELETGFRGEDRARQPKAVRAVHELIGPPPAHLAGGDITSPHALPRIRPRLRPRSTATGPARPGSGQPTEEMPAIRTAVRRRRGPRGDGRAPDPRGADPRPVAERRAEPRRDDRRAADGYPQRRPAGRYRPADARQPDPGFPPDARHPDARHPDARHPDARHPDARHPEARNPEDRHPQDRYPDARRAQPVVDPRHPGAHAPEPRHSGWDHPEQTDPGRSPVDPLTSPLGEVRRLKEDR